MKKFFKAIGTLFAGDKKEEILFTFLLLLSSALFIVWSMINS